MSANKYLQPKQFQPAQVEGWEASNWLSSREGHQWQDSIPGNEDDMARSEGLFSIKNDVETGHDTYWSGEDKGPNYEPVASYRHRNDENWKTSSYGHLVRDIFRL